MPPAKKPTPMTPGAPRQSYADPGYQDDSKPRYPCDTAEHVRAAWSYINQASNQSPYSSAQVALIKGRIRAAAKRLGVQIAEDQARAAAAGEPVGMTRITTADGGTVELVGGIVDVEEYGPDGSLWHQSSAGETPEALVAAMIEEHDDRIFTLEAQLAEARQETMDANARYEGLLRDVAAHRGLDTVALDEPQGVPV